RFHGLRRREPEQGARRLARRAVQAHSAPVVFRDLLHQRKAQPAAAGLGREERLEHAVPELGGHAGTTVAHLDLHPPAPISPPPPARGGRTRLVPASPPACSASSSRFTSARSSRRRSASTAGVAPSRSSARSTRGGRPAR